MAKNSVRDFDATAANNTDIQSVDIAENCAPSGINNAIRELMADIKDVSAGTVALESPQADSLTVTGDLTVDTSTLKVDSTNNRVGIGTTSPTSLLQSFNTATTTYSSSTADSTTFRVQTKNNSSTNGQVAAINMVASGNNGGNNASVTLNCIQDSASSHAASFAVQTRASSGTVAERMRIDSSGKVGIGTSSPGYPLHVSGNGFGTIAKFSADDGANNPRLLIYGSSDGMHIQRTSGSGASNLMFEVGGAEGGGTEAMRIDSSGDLLVGKSTTAIGTAGSRFMSNGQIQATASGQEPFFANRLSSNGVLFDFRKDGTTVGAINIFGGNTLMLDGAASVYVSNNFRPNANDTHDLGSASYKWRDIYTVGNVNTSDQNEKQQIAELTTTELAAAKRISALFKTFKWNNAVEAKGDNARTHAGVIAQDVKSALEAEGLDASKYSFWCSDTWWEHLVEVPAVEAVEAQDAVLDDDGNIVTEAVEAVEAKDAYTRRDVYGTAEEAPEGAVEVTLQSVRYNELMAFVGAATEQRLADIETRLTALEA